MGDQVAISLKNVSKCFKCYDRPIDRLKEILLPGKSRGKEFWALNNINLEINRGETLGIVGRNGSGKSTLLQIIVGTLTPTFGEVNVNGRISALLELGSGFNPEFTGRENIFFNGKILGLSKAEIEAKFDEIASFADIGDFIEQPVKTYSSGMFVRLAFAVAINVDPDILIVDEALSVGDEAFQRKCFAKIKGFQEAGKTILFVSHSAGTVVELCNWSVLMDQGELILANSPKIVVSKYHKLIYAPREKITLLREEIKKFNQPEIIIKSDNNNQISGEVSTVITPKKIEFSAKLEPFFDPNLKPQSTVVYLSRGAEIINPFLTTIGGKMVNILVKGQDYIYTYTVKFKQAAYQVRFGMLLKTMTGLELGGAGSHTIDNSVEYVAAGAEVQVEFKFSCLLLQGVYFLNNGVLGMIDGEEVYLHRTIDALMFRVQPEENMLSTGIVDFKIEPNISLKSMELIG